MCIGDIDMPAIPTFAKSVADMFRQDFEDTLNMLRFGALIHHKSYSIQPCSDNHWTEANIVNQRLVHNKLMRLHQYGDTGESDFTLSQVEHGPLLYKFIFPTEIFSSEVTRDVLFNATGLTQLVNNSTRLCVFSEIILKGYDISYVAKNRYHEKLSRWTYEEMLDNYKFIEALLYNTEDRINLPRSIDISNYESVPSTHLIDDMDWAI